MSSIAINLHRPSVSSPLNPSPTTAVAPKRRRIQIARRSHHMSPGQRLLRRKACEAYNAQQIIVNLCDTRVSSHSNKRQESYRAQTPLINLIPDQQNTFEDVETEEESSYMLSSFLMPTKSFNIAALFQAIPLPIISLIMMLLPGWTRSVSQHSEKNSEQEQIEDSCEFLQAAADLEEGRLAIVVPEHSTLPLMLTMRRVMTAIGFLCFYALMQVEPIIRRTARSYD